MENFIQRFEIIYNFFCKKAEEDGRQTSKLALARLLGISQGKMQKWEKGQVPASIDIKIIHEKLGFSYSWLITGEGPQFEEAPGGNVAALKARIAELEGELAEADRINRKLTAKLLQTDTHRHWQRGQCRIILFDEG